MRKICDKIKEAGWTGVGGLYPYFFVDLVKYV